MEGHPPDLRLRYWQAVLIAAERMQAVKAVRNQAAVQERHIPAAGNLQAVRPDCLTFFRGAEECRR